MRWLLGAFKLLVSLCVLSISLPCLAIDESRLWLPAKYQTLFLDLKEAAIAAESLENCTKVLRGTLDFDQSTEQRPIFRILCRLPDGKTYNELVDGVTKETLTTPKIIEIPLTPEEIEARRIAEEKQLAEQRAERMKMLWTECHQALIKRTELMLKVEFLNPDDQEPESESEEEVRFLFDFNAEDLNQTQLLYRATCIVRQENDLDLTIHSRRK